MTGYLDTSVLLRILLDEPYKKYALDGFEKLVSSELIEIELLRRLAIQLVSGEIDEAEHSRLSEEVSRYFKEIDLILLSRRVLARVKQPLALKVRTLDLFHLCSALLWKEQHSSDLVLITHDKDLARGAVSMGLSVVGNTAEYFVKS